MKTKLQQMKIENGAVDHGNKCVVLTQQAYIADDGETYIAHGVDADDNEYRVVWNNLYAGHICGEGGECAVPDCDGLCEDASNHCDWDSPISIEAL